MHALYRRLDPKNRRLLQLANLFLVLGMTPWIFREYITFNHNWLDALCGFFLGLSIAINLCCMRAARRCRPDEV